MRISKNDTKIINDCIKGNARAWDKFVEKFSGLVYWSIKERLAKFGYNFTHSDIEDIHQEVFLLIYKENKLSKLKNPSVIASWLAVIAGNAAINKINRIKGGALASKSVSLSEEIAKDDATCLTLIDTLKDSCPSVLDKMDRAEQEELLAKIIETLPAKEKIILNLYYLYDNSIKEIADNLNMQQGTVASIIARARDKIKKTLQSKNFDA